MKKKESVNHPQHYNMGKYEVIDVIEDWKLGFHLGNTVKYIGRAGHKSPEELLDDLKKARWYLDRKINQLNGNQNTTFTFVVPTVATFKEKQAYIMSQLKGILQRKKL